MFFRHYEHFRGAFAIRRTLFGRYKVYELLPTDYGKVKLWAATFDEYFAALEYVKNNRSQTEQIVALETAYLDRLHKKE